MGILYPDHPLESGHPLDAYTVALTSDRPRHSSALASKSPMADRVKPPKRAFVRTPARSSVMGHSDRHFPIDTPSKMGRTLERLQEPSKTRMRSDRLVDDDLSPDSSPQTRRKLRVERRNANHRPSRSRGEAERSSTLPCNARSTDDSSRVAGPRKSKSRGSDQSSVPALGPSATNGVDRQQQHRFDDSIAVIEAQNPLDWNNVNDTNGNRKDRQTRYRPPLAESGLDRSTQAEHTRPTQMYHEHQRSSTRHEDDEDRTYSYADESSLWDEVEYYKYGRISEGDERSRRRCCVAWSRRRKWVIFGSIVATIILLLIIIIAVTLTRNNYTYTASTAQVTNSEAFVSGGATRQSSNDVQDGSGPGVDEYVYYQGDASNFPSSSKWVSFDDMWNANLDSVQNSCEWLHEGSDNSPRVVADIYSAIQNRANASLVDHRFILATVLQESSGCVLAGQTTSSGGVTNPGLMQSHDGHTYDAAHSELSILWMIQDGTQGTQTGDGLVQYLNKYGNPYEAARGYNSGHIAANGDLSDAAGATACYVSDIANRLTGWVTAKSTCPGDTA